MKTVLFVNPACLDPRVTDNDATIVPIGLYYLSALLIENGFGARILNLAALGTGNTSRGPAVFADALKKESPGIIGFSVTTANRHQAMDCAQTAKTLLPESAVVFGGPAPTFMGSFFMEACPDIDFIVKGEGETACLELARALDETAPHTRQRLDRLKEINGLLFRHENRILDTGPALEISDLDSLVHPSTYFTFQHLSMSRGCPGKCTFCGSPKFWGQSRVRFHSAQWFAHEIKTLAQKGVSHFFICDDTFTMDKDRVLEFCAILIESGLSITWNAISRVDYVDRDLLAAMRKAGCIQISFGVESGSAPIKKVLGKPVSNDTAARAFSLTKAAGILPRAYFIYGSPGETQQTIEESITLLNRLGPLGAVFYMLVVFPGTYLYTRALDKNLLKADIWHEKIEDIPWFELDESLDFEQVKAFGDALRDSFYEGLEGVAQSLELDPDPALSPFHADFLSRLALTFFQGDYAADPRIKKPEQTAEALFKKALSFYPDFRAFAGLGMLYQKQRRFQEAFSFMAQGLARYPGNETLETGMGVCLMNLGDFKGALAHLNKFKGNQHLAPYIQICNQNISG